MKKLVTILMIIMLSQSAHPQNTFPASGSAGIGTLVPEPSSAFEVKSTTQGILIPRMTKAKRDAIVSPVEGLLIYQTNSTPGFYYYAGTDWKVVSPKGLNKDLSNLNSPTAANEIIQPNADNTIDLGSTAFSWKDLYVDGIGYLGTAKVGNYAGTPQEGMIRWTGTDFEGYNGSSWVSLTGAGPAYTAGAGIDISGTTITNTAPSQWSINGSNISYDNGNVGIGTSSPSEKLDINGKAKVSSFQMTNGAMGGYVLQSDASGNASWVGAETLPVTGDDLGNHTVTENIQLGSNYISSDGDNEGLFVSGEGKVNIGGNAPILRLQLTDDNTPGLRLEQTSQTYPAYTWDVAANEVNFMIRDISNSSALPFRIFAGNASDQIVINSNKVGIGILTPSEKLEVNGTTKTTNLQMTTGAANGYVLKSDSSGKASWVNANTLTVSETDPQVSSITSGKVPRWNGTTLVDGNITDNGSNVGIGTSSPGSKLTVSSGSTFAVEINGTSTSGTWIGLNNSAIGGSNWSILSGATSMLPGNLAFRDGTGNIRMAIQSSDGSVGIGTTSPTATLHTVGSGSKTISYSANLLTNEANSIVSGITKAALELKSTGSWTGVTSRNIGLYVSSVTGSVNNYDAIFNGGGNVGIGTISPAHKLEVSGTTKTTNLQVTSGATNGYVLQSDGTGNGSWVNPATLSNGNWTTTGSDQFSAVSGNVGIGTSAPSQKLEVSGTTKTTSLQVTNGASSGYVFQTDANGNGSWVNPITLQNGNWTINGSNQYSAVSGDIGIGTNSPLAKLHVHNSTGSVVLRIESGAGNAGMRLVASGSGLEASTALNTGTSQRWSFGKSNSAESGSNAGSDFFINRFDDSGNYLGQPLVIRRSSGYVGIGTSSPLQALDVNGTAKTNSLQMTNGATNGYVLQSDASGYASWVNPATLANGNWTTNGTDQYSALSGNVGIGTSSPSHKLTIEGSVTGNNQIVLISNTSNNNNNQCDGLLIRAGTNQGQGASYLLRLQRPDEQGLGAIIQSGSNAVQYVSLSDQRLKENIRDTRFGLDDLMKIQVSDYNYKDDRSKTEQTGYIAQQLYEVFPDAVNAGGDDVKTNPWMVDYGRITPLIVKSVQELAVENEKLKMENVEQQQQLESLNRKLDEVLNKLQVVETSMSQCCTAHEQSSTANTEVKIGDIPVLEQNVPNPFLQTSYIKFYIPSYANDAVIVVSDMNGKVLKQFRQLSPGFGTVNINAGTLAAGVYQYMLLIGGKVIDTKQMVLTR